MAMEGNNSSVRNLQFRCWEVGLLSSSEEKSLLEIMHIQRVKKKEYREMGRDGY